MKQITTEITESITREYIEENLFSVNGSLNSWKLKNIKKSKEEIYLIYHNIEAPKCYCGNKPNFKDFTTGYYTFCSNTCSRNFKLTEYQPITRQYIKDNLIDASGGLNGRKTSKLRENDEELYLIYHNIEVPKCECGKSPTFNSFGRGYNTFCSSKCSNNNEIKKEKFKTTSMIKWGVKNPFQSEVIKTQIKITNLKNLGVEYPMQSKEVQENYKQTCLMKWGFEYPMQSKEVQENYKQTCLMKWGFEYPMQSKEVQENYKQSCMKNLGVENPMQSKEVQENYRQTCIRNWGTEHPMQSGLFGNSGYKWEDYIYPSGRVVRVQGYEPKLLDELVLVYEENEILTDRKDMPEFWYYSNDGKKHRYFPDVYIPKENLIYEVKSSWTLEQTKKDNIYDLKKQSVVDEGFDFKLRVF